MRGYSPYVTITNENIKDAETNSARFMRKPVKSNLLTEIGCSIEIRMWKDNLLYAMYFNFL